MEDADVNGKKPGSFQGIIHDVIQNMKAQAPSATRFGVGLLLRTLAGNKECVEAMAIAMAEDEDAAWNGLPGTEKRVWRLRAKAALVGLDRFVAKMSK